jgi:hypothetical protein
MVFRRVIECRHPFAVSSWPCSRASLNLRLIREVGAQFLSCLTNAASAPSPNLFPRWERPSRGEGLKKRAVSMQESPFSHHLRPNGRHLGVVHPGDL